MSITLGEMKFRHDKLNQMKSIIDDPALDFNDKMNRIKKVADEKYQEPISKKSESFSEQFEKLFGNTDKMIDEFFRFNKQMNSI